MVVELHIYVYLTYIKLLPSIVHCAIPDTPDILVVAPISCKLLPLCDNITLCMIAKNI